MEKELTLSDVVTRLDALTTRLERLERGHRPEPPVPFNTVRVEESRPKPSVAALSPKKNTSGNWLGILGVGCFVLAVGYLIKIGVDSGWLTPARQLILAYTFSALLVWLGSRFRGGDFEYASYLAGAGFVGLFLATIGGVVITGTFSSATGSVILLLLSWACIAVGAQFHPYAYLVVAVLGAYGGPVWFFGDGGGFLVPYYCVASLSFSTLALMRGERSLNLLSAYGALFATSQATMGTVVDGSFAIVSIAMVFLIHLLGIFLHTKRTGHGLTSSEAYAYIPLIIFAYALEYVPFSKYHPELWVYFGIGFSVSLVLLQEIAAHLLRLEKSSPSRDVALSAALLIFTHAVIYQWLPESFHHVLGLALVIALAVAPVKSESLEGLRVFGWVTRTLGAFFILSSYFEIFTRAIAENSLIHAIQALLFGASIAVTLLRREAWMRGFGKIGVSASHAMMLAGFYGLFSEQGPLAVSISWIVYAFLCIGVGFVFRNTAFARLSVLALGAIGGKVLFYDLWNTGALVRVLILALSGAALYGGGYAYRRIGTWEKK